MTLRHTSGPILSMVAIGFLVVSASPATADDIGSPSLVLSIRVYDSHMMAPADWQVALASAAAIFDLAGIATHWLICDLRQPSDTRRRCDVPVREDELVIRLVRVEQGVPDTGPVSLGYSLVDVQHRRGALATIHYDRVSWLAQAAGIDVRMLVGRAIAHEAGHLTLGSNEHGETGIMRAIWTREALEQSGPDEWLFTPGEAVLMRTSLESRSPGVVASAAGLRP